MRKLTIAGIACVALAGSTAPASGGLLSATGEVIAIMAGNLFVGEAEGHLSGAGTLAIHAQKNPALTCTGEFTSSKELGGKGQLRCSDGTTSTFKFQRLNLRQGHGSGNFGRGSMNFTYGLTADQARSYLKLPKGKQLRQSGAKLELVNAT